MEFIVKKISDSAYYSILPQDVFNELQIGGSLPKFALECVNDRIYEGMEIHPNIMMLVHTYIKLDLKFPTEPCIMFTFANEAYKKVLEWIHIRYPWMFDISIGSEMFKPAWTDAITWAWNKQMFNDSTLEHAMNAWCLANKYRIDLKELEEEYEQILINDNV